MSTLVEIERKLSKVSQGQRYSFIEPTHAMKGIYMRIRNKERLEQVVINELRLSETPNQDIFACLTLTII